MQLSSVNPRAKALKRLLIGSAEDCELDAQGRVLIPATQRVFAGLTKRVVLVGQGQRFELWDEQTWQNLQAELLEKNYGELSAELESIVY